MEISTTTKQTWANTWYDWHAPSLQEYCVANDIQVPEENTAQWWEVIDSIRNFEIEDFWDNLRFSEYRDRPCIVTGTLGLWWGRPEISPKFCSDLTDALRACLQYADEYEVYSENGVLHVVAYHHDGHNSFEVHVVKNDSESLDKFRQFRNMVESGSDFDDLSIGVFSEQIEYLY